MQDNGIQLAPSSGGPLAASDYQTFELAKENDAILGGDNIAQIRSYAAYARAQAQAIHKTIAATSGIEDVAAIKQEALETEQTFAKVGIYADQRIGEILRELPTRQGARTDTSVTAGTEVTKRQAEQDAGISHKQSIDLQALAANPEVVQAVLDKAESEGRVASRKQVLDAIRERKLAEQERDKARQDLADAYHSAELMESEVESLKQQVAAKPKPEVVEREVVREVTPEDYEEVKRRLRDLEHDSRVTADTNRQLRKERDDARKELDKARDLLGMDKTMQDIRRDVQYLTTATTNYVRRYGGLTWTAQSFSDVDAATREELTKAVRNLATFANTLMSTLEEVNSNGR